MKKIKWRAILALALIAVIIYFNWTWGWAILFFIWVIPDFFSGVTYLMEPVKKAENPLLYWVILLTWVLLSIFLLFDQFAPHQLPTGWSTSDSMVYKSYNQGDYKIDYNRHLSLKDTLFYKNHLAPAFNIVGISTQTTFRNNEVDGALTELWEVFNKEDISTVIPDIIDDKIYVIQSNFDKNKEGYFTLTIGYKTASLNNIYKGLTGVKVNASKYAVVEIDEQPIHNLTSVWEKIVLSDLPTVNLNNVEVFHYNAKSKKVEKIDIWLSIPMSEKDKALVKKQTKPFKEAAISDSAQIKAIPITIPYQESSPKTTHQAKNESKVETYPTHQHKAFTIVGIQTIVNHQNDEKINQSINALWESFFQKDYSKYIYNVVDYETIYLSYSNYTDNKVTLTLGYATENANEFNQKKNLRAISIPQNEYYHFSLDANQSKYGAKEWEILDEVIPYRAVESCDFEMYQFDKNYNITSSFLWIGAK